VTTQLDEASPLWSRRLISEFNAADDRATALARALTPQQLNWKRSPGEWSIGQCLEHLYITNEVYCQSISNSLGGHPVSVVEEIGPGWFGRWFIRNYIEPSSETRRGRAPKKITPLPFGECRKVVERPRAHEGLRKRHVLDQCLLDAMRLGRTPTKQRQGTNDLQPDFPLVARGERADEDLTIA
jgi:hypothetical protein